MSDLRWRDDGADPTIAELLESARIDEPTPESLDRLRSRVAFLFTLPPGAAGSAGGAGSAGSSSAGGASASGAAGVTGGVVTKAIVVGAVTLGVVGATLGLTRPEPSAPPAPSVPTPVAIEREPQATPPPVEVPPPAEPVREEKPPAPVRPRPARSAAATTPQKAPERDEELDLLQKAMAASSPELALSHAEQHRRRFPSSPMAQEREVIAIEALAKLHRIELARARAEQFRTAWPTSTHLPRIDALLRGP